jgi:hypothetical protein
MGCLQAIYSGIQSRFPFSTRLKAPFSYPQCTSPAVYMKNVLFLLLLSAALGIHSAGATKIHGWSQPELPASPRALSEPAIGSTPLLSSKDAVRIHSNDWTLAPPPPISIMEHALVTLACDAGISYPAGTSASLILIGGSNASGAASPTVLSFDIDHKQWLVLQPMPEPREASMAVFSQSWGGIVVCGGR